MFLSGKCASASACAHTGILLETEADGEARVHKMSEEGCGAPPPCCIVACEGHMHPFCSMCTILHSHSPCTPFYQQQSRRCFCMGHHRTSFCTGRVARRCCISIRSHSRFLKLCMLSL